MNARYLDNAATSWPKAPGFAERAGALLASPWGNPHRGAHAAARGSEALIARVRAKIARLINAPSPEHIVIGHNTTEMLNLAIQGIAARFAPAAAITSVLEHNSVLRPLYGLADDHGVSLTLCEPARDGALDLRPALEAAAELSHKPALVALAHVSNTVGHRRDLAALARSCREYGAWLVVDGAQSVGMLAIDVQAQAVDALAFPGHKGLLGPTGLGFLYLGPRLLHAGLAPLRVGGGGDARLREGPAEAPARFEAGTPNLHGLMLIEPCLDWLAARGNAGAGDDTLAEALCDALADAPAVHVYGDRATCRGSGIVLCNVGALDSHTVAQLLDSEFGIATRAGLHCAPLAHDWLGTSQSHQGAVRISFGKFNGPDDVAAVAAALRRIAAHAQ